MKEKFFALVDWLASISILVSLVSYYLSLNKTWLVKHEPSVATSVSISSYLIYGTTLVLLTTKMILDGAPWQGTAEYFLTLGHSAFMIWIGLGWWVPGRRERGVFRLLRESLRTERQNIGALARAFMQPAGASQIVELLARLAVIDGSLDPRERQFIETFARTWRVKFDVASVERSPKLDGAVKYTSLRRDLERYLALSPPRDQALQLSDVIRRLVEIDGTVTPREQLIVAELGGLLKRYGGEEEPARYEVHLVPQSRDQADAMISRFPDYPVRELTFGPILIAGEYFSPRYAEIVRREFLALRLYAAVERKQDAISNVPEPA